MTKPLAEEDQFNQEFLWTVARYERAIEAGVFTEDDKIELLYGKIIELMPAGADHEYCITLLAKFFRKRFGEDFQLREEKSLVLVNGLSLPEPDIVVVADKNYSRKKPTAEDVYLVVEVANTSLLRDRTIKVELYAEANLAEYWIVNLINRQIEVHLQPDAEQGVYASVNIYKLGATFVSPFAGEVVVGALLPDPEEE